MENNIPKIGDILHLRATEHVVKEIGLEIGKDISLGDAENLIFLIENSDEFFDYTPGFDLIQDVIGEDDNIVDTNRFNCVDYDLEH